MIRNVQKEWKNIIGGIEDYPEFDRPVYAIFEYDTFHDDDEPYVLPVVLRKLDPNRLGRQVRFETLDGDTFCESRFVVMWRYISDL